MSLSRQQLTLLGIFALFIGPVVLVIMMRSTWWQYQPSGMKNNGYLVQPPVSLSLSRTQETDNKWLILHVLEKDCDEPCIEHVTALRQIHRASGRHGEHLAIVLLSETEAGQTLQSRLSSIYPEFSLMTDPESALLSTLVSINGSVAPEAVNPDDVRTYILDPMSNVILAYRVDANPGDLHKDLKRLLKWSDKESRQ